MPVQGMEMLSPVARELHISEEELLRQGLRVHFITTAYSLFRLEQQVNQLVAQLLHLVDITIRCCLTNALDHLSQLRRQSGVEVRPVQRAGGPFKERHSARVEFHCLRFRFLR